MTDDIKIFVILQIYKWAFSGDQHDGNNLPPPPPPPSDIYMMRF
jgi:hypothetical protein